MEIVNECSDMHDIPILSQLKEFKAIFLWKIFPYHRNFSPKLIKVPVLLFDTLEYFSKWVSGPMAEMGRTVRAL